MNKLTETYSNPIDRRYFQITILATISIATFTIIYSSWRFENRNLLTTIITIIVTMVCSSIPFTIGWTYEFWRRPYLVIIGEDGLALYFRYGRKLRIVHWEEILSLKTPNDNISNKGRDGHLFVSDLKKKKGWDMFVLYAPIAIAAREKFKEKTNRYPFTRVWDNPAYKGKRPNVR